MANYQVARNRGDQEHLPVKLAAFNGLFEVHAGP
jgi:hypothetical protein